MTKFTKADMKDLLNLLQHMGDIDDALEMGDLSMTPHGKNEYGQEICKWECNEDGMYYADPVEFQYKGVPVFDLVVNQEETGYIIKLHDNIEKNTLDNMINALDGADVDTAGHKVIDDRPLERD